MSKFVIVIEDLADGSVFVETVPSISRIQAAALADQSLQLSPATLYAIAAWQGMTKEAQGSVDAQAAGSAGWRLIDQTH